MPSLRERVGNWIAGKRATTESPEFQINPAASFGPGIGNQPDFDTLLREPRGIYHAAKRAIANRIGSLEPQVKLVRRVRNGTVEEEILDDHPLQLLLNRPHPNRSRREVMNLTTQWLIDAGEAYWLKIGNRLGRPAELHLAKPGSLWPVVQRGVIQHFNVRDATGHVKPVRADAVVRFVLPDPENPWGAEGYLAPLGIEADSTKFAGEHLRTHYQHDATPKTFLEAAPGTSSPSKEELDRFFVWWRDNYDNRSGRRIGLPAIGPSGFKLIQVAMQSGADIRPLLEFWRENQLMGVGTPHTVLGLVQSGDRSSAETNSWVFDRYTVTPIADVIADALTMQLAPDFDASLRVEFAPFVSEDKDYELKREAHDIEHAIRTPNKVLTDREDDTVPWGDQPLISTKVKPYDPDARDEDDVPPDEDGEDVDMDGEPMAESEDPEERRRAVARRRRNRSRRARARRAA